MANKELSLWCKLKFVVGSKKSVYAEDCHSKFFEDWIIESDESYEDEMQIFHHYIEGTHIYFCTDCEESVLVYSNDFEIIWHPVMIGDVMYYIRKKYWNNHSWFHSDRSKLIDLRSKEREPIEWQYDECIDFIYSLIPKS